MNKPKLPQPLQDALDWAEVPVVAEEVGMRLQNHGPYFMATGNALAIVAAAYREAITENENLRQQIEKLTQ